MAVQRTDVEFAPDSGAKRRGGSQDPSLRRFLVSAAAGVASLALADMPSAMAAPAPSGNAAVQGPASSLPTLSEVLSGDPGPMKIVNYAMYVQDRDKVDASRAEHQAYADSLREHDRLVMGGPLLDDGGRPRGVLLVYDVASKQQAETLAQNINYAKYVSDLSQVDRVRLAHQSYARTLKASGELIMAGPLADGSGALTIYRARSKDEAMALVLEDPYHAAGVFETYALSEWRLFGLNAGLIQGR